MGGFEEEPVHLCTSYVFAMYSDCWHVWMYVCVFQRRAVKVIELCNLNYTDLQNMLFCIDGCVYMLYI